MTAAGRNPRGQPAGGQFAPQTHDAPSVALGTSESVELLETLVAERDELNTRIEDASWDTLRDALWARYPTARRARFYVYESGLALDSVEVDNARVQIQGTDTRLLARNLVEMAKDHPSGTFVWLPL